MLRALGLLWYTRNHAYTHKHTRTRTRTHTGRNREWGQALAPGVPCLQVCGVCMRCVYAYVHVCGQALPRVVQSS